MVQTTLSFIIYFSFSPFSFHFPPAQMVQTTLSFIISFFFLLQFSKFQFRLNVSLLRWCFFLLSLKPVSSFSDGADTLILIFFFFLFFPFSQMVQTTLERFTGTMREIEDTRALLLGQAKIVLSDSLQVGELCMYLCVGVCVGV